MAKLYVKGIVSTLIGAVLLAAVLFGGAGTFAYWQGWLFFVVFEACSIGTGIYFAIHDPKLIERRMSVGPTAEKETSQKIIMLLAFIGFIALIVVPAFDRRLGWSAMPASVAVSVAILGNVLVTLGFAICFRVFQVNSYGGSTVQVFEGQKVVSTGPYALVRHPMYSGAAIMVLGTPLALGSLWGLLIAVLILPVLAWRLIDEEQFLAKNLPGYADYMRNVPYRLVPEVW
jgi:protein-S-isoprenylcysteine O-methyltransferase Ste14